MAFRDQHQYYKEYSTTSDCYLHDVPNAAWGELENLIEEAGGDERQSLAEVVQFVAQIARAGNVSDGVPYQRIPEIVSKLRRKVRDGRFDLFMDCLAILCERGELSVDSLNEYLEENDFGYRAVVVWGSVRWETIEEVDTAQKTVIHNQMHSKNKTFSKTKNEGENKMRDMVFLSHRTEDAAVADMILDFLVCCGIPREKIFCSSLPGNDVKEVISSEVKDNLKRATVVFLILSDGYYESAYCLNEAGVAWFIDDIRAIPIGLPEISHDKMVGFLNRDYKLRRLDNEEDIPELYDLVSERLEIKSSHSFSVVAQESRKLQKKYIKYLEDRKKKTEDSSTQNNTSENESSSDDVILQTITDEGGEIIGIDAFANKMGISPASLRRKLKGYVESGKIEVLHRGRCKVYRISKV